MEMNKIYEVVNKLNILYDKIGDDINEILSPEELRLLIDYINILEQRSFKTLKR